MDWLIFHIKLLAFYMKIDYQYLFIIFMMLLAVLTSMIFILLYEYVHTIIFVVLAVVITLFGSVYYLMKNS